VCYLVNFFYNSFDGIFTSNFSSFISPPDMATNNIKILKLLSDECIDFIEKRIVYFDIFSENFIFSIEAEIRPSIISKDVFIVSRYFLSCILCFSFMRIIRFPFYHDSSKIIFPPIWSFSYIEIVSCIKQKLRTIPSFFTIIYIS